MSVRIRMKRMGRTHRPYYRICAMDKRAPRDGRVLEELGTYDPSVPDTDARAILKQERIDYWIGVGAQPSDNVAVLIKKYGTGGTHLAAQQAALDNIAQPKVVPDPGKPASMPKADEPEEPKTEEAKAEAPAESSPEAEAEAKEPETPTEGGGEAASEATDTEEKPSEEAASTE